MRLNQLQNHERAFTSETQTVLLGSFPSVKSRHLATQQLPEILPISEAFRALNPLDKFGFQHRNTEAQTPEVFASPWRFHNDHKNREPFVCLPEFVRTDRSMMHKRIRPF